MKIRDKYNPDYHKLYPGVHISQEVMDALQQSDRKMKYMEIDLKQSGFRQEKAEFCSGREFSLDSLLEDETVDIPSRSPMPEDIAIQHEEIERVRKALHMLEPDEFDLIWALFFESLTERAYANRLGISQKAVNKRWHKIRTKLKILLKR